MTTNINSEAATYAISAIRIIRYEISFETNKMPLKSVVDVQWKQQLYVFISHKY